MPSRKAEEDEFILTLSDREASPTSDTELPESTKQGTSTSQKRKRTDLPNGDGENHKKQKKITKTQPRTVGRDDDDDDSESESESVNGVRDEAIDPEFEFDIGGVDLVGGTEDFDGWGEERTVMNNSGRARGQKKGVDIDELIARKAGRVNKLLSGDKKVEEKAAANDSEGSDDVSEEELDEEEEDLDSVDEEMEDDINFDDDELLATDAFGANGLDTSEGEDEDSDQGEDDGMNEDEQDNSENESAASPVAHPDDMDSDHEESDSQSSVSDADEAAKRAAFFAPEQSHKVQPNISSVNSFQQFSLSRPILRGLAALSFATPTPIQVRTIPIALQGLDVVGSAVTGSGKTAAFLLPILERLLYRPRKVPTTRVVILMPTRELAVQCYNVAIALARFTDIKFAQIVGGFSLREQETILKQRPDVVIATPGRFIDHMRNSASFAVENVEILVLDEADRMLETGFEDELNEILKTIPKSRQTMLFSATMTDSVDKLVRVGMNRPVRLSVDAKKSTTSGLIQEFVRLRPGREKLRLATLCCLCTGPFDERTIIFFRQKKEAHRVRVIFGLLGIKAGELHGSMSQEQRLSAVNAFKDGRTTHLLATDLASRGLDIKNVMSVVNYEAPQTHEIYVHRVGRTARAGRSGRACTIAAEPDRKVVKAAVKSGRQQGAKIVSRVVDASAVDTMQQKIDSLSDDVEEILAMEKEEKQLSQAETQLTRGENLIKHEAEIMSRPKRTWFESEKEKTRAHEKGAIELNGPDAKLKNSKKKLSGKDKKKLDDRRERLEGKIWRKGKSSEKEAKADKAAKKKAKRGKKR